MYKVGGAAKKRLVPLEDKQTGGSSTGLFEVRPPSNAGKDWPAQSDTRMNEYLENEEGGCATSNHRSMGPFLQISALQSTRRPWLATPGNCRQIRRRTAPSTAAAEWDGR